MGRPDYFFIMVKSSCMRDTPRESTLVCTRFMNAQSRHRKMLGILWPEKISNQDLYNLTNKKEWGEIIQECQLRWIGHVIRLPEDSPLTTALHQALIPGKKPRGGQLITYLDVLKRDLSNTPLDLNNVDTWQVAADRGTWRQILSGAVLFNGST